MNCVLEPEIAHQDEKYKQVTQGYPLAEDPSCDGVTSW